MGLECEEGKLTTLLGRNGMGKTTTVKSIIGKVSVTHGEISFRGESIIGMPTYDIIRKGIGLVPEGRHIFPNLSVKENLVATANKNSGLATEWTVDQVVEFFPALGDRLNHMGDQLSGGEQQMLAIGRALMLNPQMLILDEATEGLAPLVRQEIWNRLVEIKQLGITILLIDKNIDEFIDISDFHYIIEKGRQVWAGPSRELVDDSGLESTVPRHLIFQRRGLVRQVSRN